MPVAAVPEERGIGHAVRKAQVGRERYVHRRRTDRTRPEAPTERRRHRVGHARDAEPRAWVPPTWEEIVEEHSARVYRLAYRLTGNVHDAEDLTHDVFIRVFRSLNSYTPGTFEGWLHRITTNVFLDQMRRKQRIRFDALSEESSARLPSREPGPEQAYDERHFDDDVQRALDALPPDFRAAVVLCDIEGLSYEEIAATLGSSSGRSARGSTAAARSCGTRSRTGRPPPPPPPGAPPRRAHPSPSEGRWQAHDEPPPRSARPPLPRRAGVGLRRGRPRPGRAPWVGPAPRRLRPLPSGRRGGAPAA